MYFILIAWFIPLLVTAAIHTSGNLLIFGDDLGDTGNLQKLLNATSLTKNTQGQVCNGPVFVEYMATQLNLQIHSYAFANSTLLETHDGVPSLKYQIEQFTESEKEWIRQSKPSTSIAVITAGLSDVMQRQDKWTADRLLGFGKHMVTLIFKQVDILSKLGFKGILITNLPALHILPKWQSSVLVDTFRDLVKSTNTLFRESLLTHERKTPKTKLWMLDLESFLLVTANNTFAPVIGAQNTAGSCINPASGERCQDPNEFVFYDWIHPDVRLHHLLGLAGANLVNGNEVLYNSMYFQHLAEQYDIGVLHTSNQTMSVAQPLEYSATNSSSSVAADPLFTSTSTCSSIEWSTTGDKFSETLSQTSDTSGWSWSCHMFVWVFLASVI